MERNYIWILTNSNGSFIKAVATRESAKAEIEMWRENIIKIGVFEQVSRLDAVYEDRISFNVTDRNGKESECVARKTILY